VIIDDHSTDDTVPICCAAGAKVIISPFDGLDETRDKNHLLHHALMLGPTWIINIDGDEILAPGSAEVLRSMMKLSDAAYSFRVRYLWDRRDQVRTDGVYGSFRTLCMFRVVGQPAELRYMTTGMPGNLHCTRVPAGVHGPRAHLPVDLLHLGYLHRNDRLVKYERYTRLDPGNVSEDGYRHIVQGDIPEVPAEARLKWGGPLRLEPYPASAGIAQSTNP